MAVRIRYRNELLSALTQGDRNLLGRSLRPVVLPLKLVLEEPDTPIRHAYFFESGMASVIAGKGSKRIEVGIIGHDGMSGLSIVMGDDRSINETFMQGAGNGFRLPVAALRQAMQSSPTLRLGLLRYAQVFGVQISQTALANGRDKLEARLARWLLMAHDRFDQGDFPFTHEFLALMLGVRRAGVTIALHFLEGAGLIRSGRRLIKVIDRPGLLKHANGSYGVPEAEYERLIGKSARSRSSAGR